MNAPSDSQLLRTYAERHSEAAFAELVRRHIDLVHSAALRMVNDPHLAKDVSQGVFVALAKDAGKLANHPVLSGWLHKTARNIAAQTVRAEVRRRKRELEVTAMQEHPEIDASWEEVAPHLDAALSELAISERDAVLLRYFENKSARDMAPLLGISAEAAQKRVRRAVEKLRENLAKRGITAGTAGLTGAISANAMQVAPAGLAGVVSSAAMGEAVVATAAATKVFAMTTFHKALAVAAVAAFAGTAIYQTISRAQPQELSGADSSKPASQYEVDRRRHDSLVERLAKTRAEKPPIDRKAELARLKVLWMEPDKNSGLITKEHKKLANETAKALLSGGEALELVVFLKANQRNIAADVVRDGISDYLAATHDREALRLLIEESRENRHEMQTLRGDPVAWKSAASQRHQLLATWSKAAGRSCTPETLEELRGGLQDDEFSQEALIGYNTQLMQSDPEAAVRATVKALESQIQSPSAYESIKLLFWEDLPPELDFAKLEALLPTDAAPPESGPDLDPIANGRRALFWKWGERDPAAAANYVIEHSDRLKVKLIEEIVGAYFYKDPNAIVPWVSQFPEGKVFDTAAASAAIYARGQPGISEVIERIQDPEVREKARKSANVPLTNPNTR